MKRVGIGIAAVALALVGACGGSGSDQPAAPPKKIALADACPKVQDALDRTFKNDMDDATGAQYRRFADSIQALTEKTDAKGGPILTALFDKTNDSAVMEDSDDVTPSYRVQTDQAWLSALNRVSDTCEQLGAPLS